MDKAIYDWENRNCAGNEVAQKPVIFNPNVAVVSRSVTSEEYEPKNRMHLQCEHKTVYHYPGPAVESHNEIRLMPLTDEHQTCVAFRLLVAPIARVFSYAEPGGMVHHFAIRGAHAIMEIVATATVETRLSNPFESLNLIMDDFDFYQQTTTRHAYAEFLIPSLYVPFHREAAEWAYSLKKPGESVANYLLELNRQIHDRMDYDQDATHVHSTLEEIWNLKAGVCQDFAHLMLACTRALGIPSRYVSGYLFGGEDTGIRGDQATHAWVECVLPSGKWLALDPTNNLLANDRHIRVHLGRDYADVTPSKGIYIGWAAKNLEVDVTVREIEQLAIATDRPLQRASMRRVDQA